MMHRKWLAGLVVTGTAAAVLWAQQEPGALIRSQVNVITAPTVVLDRDGRFVTDLKPSNFVLYDNDKKQDIRVDEAVMPLSVVVAIQANAKAEGVLPKIQKIGTILQALVAGDNGEVAILAFDHRMNVLQDFTNDPTKLQEALKKLKPGSSSNAITDAVTTSSRMLRSRPKNRRRIILLIAESKEQGSEGRAREALSTIEIDNVMVYALNMSRIYTEFTAKVPVPRPDPIPATARHVPAGGQISPTAMAQNTGSQGYGMDFAPLLAEVFRGAKAIFVDNPVEVYTKYSGGKEFPFVSQRDLETAVDGVGRELHNQYLITYAPSNRMEGGYHKIEVRVASRPDLEVRSRQGYWLAAVPQ